MTACAFPECPMPRKSLSWCAGHYAQWHQGRELAPLRRPTHGPHDCARHQPGSACCYTSCGCRCRPCLDARKRERKQGEVGLRKRVPAIGTVRRLQGLAADGWFDAEIAAAVGVTPGHISRLRRATTTVRRSTATRVRSACKQLARMPSPPGWRRDSRRAFAAHRGWAPLAAWDDIDDPAATPQTGDARRKGSTIENIAWCIESGETNILAIAARVGITPESVDRALHGAGRHDLVARLSDPISIARRARGRAA